MSVKWFSFDGESFEVHETEQKARECAEEAMDFWSEDAMDSGWNELASQVCYGIITHSVHVEQREAMEHEVLPKGCIGVETHELTKDVPDTHQCNICGGLVQYCGGKPSVSFGPGGKQKEVPL